MIQSSKPINKINLYNREESLNKKYKNKSKSKPKLKDKKEKLFNDGFKK